ncbi:hypothetical protein JCM19046_3335 [Bacillus sp. JCM 19046]|nr:hypothetical protein JCM19045_830 [Bacillus sp. JCM 19045]GAF18746.1 hypothetical protein JCM19046_3335 [Bacillus sp. JCM 19046]
MLLLLSGCWDRSELDEVFFIDAIGIERVEGQFKVTFQALNPSEIASEERGRGFSQVINYEAKAPTLHEAIRRVTLSAPRIPRISQLNLLIISEDAAKEGLKNILDLLYRDHNSRATFQILISHGDVSPTDILNVKTPIEITSKSIVEGQEIASKVYGANKISTTDVLYYELTSPGIEPTVTGISIAGKNNETESEEDQNVTTIQPKSMLISNKTALFKEDKLIGWLNQQESKSLNYFTKESYQSVGSFTCPTGGELALEIQDVHRNLFSSVKNDTPYLKYEFDIEAMISEVDCAGLDLKEESVFREVEKDGEQELKKVLTELIKKLTELQTDSIGIGREFYRNHPNYWTEVMEPNENYMDDVKIEIEASYSIRNAGSKLNSVNK